MYYTRMNELQWEIIVLSQEKIFKLFDGSVRKSYTFDLIYLYILYRVSRKCKIEGVLVINIAHGTMVGMGLVWELSHLKGRTPP